MMGPVPGSFPIDQEMAGCGYSGKPMVVVSDRTAVKDAFKRIADNRMQRLESRPGLSPE
jgi:hypothetical protein